MSMRKNFSILFALFITLVSCNSVIAQNEKKIAYGILIDNTGSLRTQFSEVAMFGKGIVRHVHGNGPTSLFSFVTQGSKNNQMATVESGVEWSQDKNVLDSFIDNLFVIGGQTTIRDAISSIAENLNAKVSHDPEAFAAKVIILVTDGEDRKSKVAEKQLIQALKESGIKVYAVGLVQELEADSGIIGKGSRDRAVKFLEKITKETGGRAVFPKSGKIEIDSLVRALLAG